MRNLMISLSFFVYSASCFAAGSRPSDLISQEQHADSECRGKPGGSDRSNAGCKARQLIEDKLYAIGWCYGRPGEASFQMDWHKCGLSEKHAVDKITDTAFSGSWICGINNITLGDGVYVSNDRIRRYTTNKIAGGGYLLFSDGLMLGTVFIKDNDHIEFNTNVEQMAPLCIRKEAKTIQVEQAQAAGVIPIQQTLGHANEAGKRACILGAIEDIPRTPGAIIGDAIAEEKAVPIIAAALVSEFTNTEKLARDLDPALIILSDRLQEGIRRYNARGDFANAGMLLREAIIAKTRAAYVVKIPFKVAGQDAYFSTICLQSVYDRNFTLPLGLH